MNADQAQKLLADAVAATGASLKRTALEVAEYGLRRSAHMAALVGGPAYQEALVHETNAAAQFAGVAAVGEGDAADARLWGLLHGVLLFGAQAAAGAR